MAKRNGETVLQINPDKKYARHSEGSFVTLNDGRIMFVYSRFNDEKHDHGSAMLIARFSDDDGRTWTKRDHVVLDDKSAQNVMSVSLLRLQDGRIAMLYLRKRAKARGQMACVPQISFSSDEGKTWSKGKNITVALDDYFVVNNDRLVQLESGRLIFPASHHRSKLLPVTPKDKTIANWRLSSPGLVTFFYSDDAGKTWMESRNALYASFISGQGLQEPGVVELNNGRLWAWARAGGSAIPGKYYRQWQSFSKDKGVTWGAVEASQFVSPCSPLSMKRIPQTGDLLVVWNDHRNLKGSVPKGMMLARNPLVAAISKNDGKTLQHRFVLEKEPGHGYCYTAIHFTDDAVLLAYCAGSKETGGVLNRLRMRRVPLKNFYR